MSVHQTTTLKWTFADDVEAYETAGIGAIGVSRRKLDDYGSERGVERLRESRLAVSSLNWIGGFTGANAFGVDEAIADAAETIQLAGRLGAGSVGVIAGGQNGHIRSHARRLVGDALRQLADTASDAGVRLALQPLHPASGRKWSFLATLDETLAVLERVDHPAVGLAFNAFHLWDEPQLLSRIADIAPLTAVVQVSDARSDTRQDHARLLPGDGCAPLAEIIAAFEEGGYRGWYEVEVWSRDLWNRTDAGLMTDCRERFAALWPR